MIETIDAALREPYHRIDEYRELGANWDGEDAPPIGEEVANRAKNLLRVVREAATERDVHWRSPTVTPTPDGGLDLSWEVGSRWAALTSQPGEPEVECVTQENGAAPEYRTECQERAIDRALWAMADGGAS